MGYAALGDRAGERLQNIKTTGPAATLTAGTFVFALGPWFPKAFPDLMAARIRTPLGHVHYFGTPPGDDRFTFPEPAELQLPWRHRLAGAAARQSRIPRAPARIGTRPIRIRAIARSIAATTRSRARSSPSAFRCHGGAPLLETRACHYEMSASGNFIIDRYPGFANVWVAGGGTAEGFKFGPVVGEYIAKRVLGIEDDPALRGVQLAVGIAEYCNC